MCGEYRVCKQIKHSWLAMNAIGAQATLIAIQCLSTGPRSTPFCLLSHAHSVLILVGAPSSGID
jgi:hypothetical protein